MTAIERLSRPESRQNAQASLSDERDPVCGKMIDPATAKDRSEHAGHTYISAAPVVATGSRPTRYAM